MSALPSAIHAVHAHFEPMGAAHLDAVLAIEQSAYSHPWSRGNFSDSMAAGYQLQCLVGGADVLGYFVAMAGYREVHLLNITVAPAHQRQGWARCLLDALVLWARGQRAQSLWLEVRQSNQGARRVYERCGFQQVGLRRAYYPNGPSGREDAVVMCLLLDAAPAPAPAPGASP